jgi:hypothetical protein
MSDRRAASKARRRQGIRAYTVFCPEHLLEGALAHLRYLKAVEPEHRDTEAALQVFMCELLASYSESDGDVSPPTLTIRAMFGETNSHEDR